MAAVRFCLARQIVDRKKTALGRFSLWILFGFSQSSQTLGADVRAFALGEQGRPLQVGPLLGPSGRIELTAELFPGSAHNERFSAFFAHSHDKKKNRGYFFTCQYNPAEFNL